MWIRHLKIHRLTSSRDCFFSPSPSILPALDLDADKQAFVAAVMAPLGDDPPRLELLEECLAIAGTYPCAIQGDPIELATQRMRETAPSFPWHHRLGLILPALLFLIAGWFCLFGPPAWKSLDEVLLANRILGSMSDMCCAEKYVPSFANIGLRVREFEDVPQIRRVIRRMDRDSRLLVYGDLAQEDKVARWKAVWDRYPEDPAHFMAYAYKHQEINKEWPAELVTQGEALDPGNGWFRFLAASAKVASSLGTAPPPPSPPKGRAALAAGKPPHRMAKPLRPITDPAAFAEGFTMLEEAMATPRWDDYVPTLNRIRFEAVPPGQNFGEHALNLVMAAFQPEDWGSGWEGLRSWQDALGVAIGQAAKDGDRAKLEKLAATLEQLEFRLAAMPAELVPRYFARVLVFYAYRDLAKAWTDLGEVAKATRFDTAADVLDPKLHPRPSFPPDDLDEGRGSGFTSKFYSGSRAQYSTPVTEPELRGGRLAEYAVYERFIVHAVAVFVLLVGIVVMVAMWRDRHVLGLLPARLSGLLDSGDRARVFALGWILPLLLYLISTRSSLLAPRDTGLGEVRFLLWLLQAGSLVMAIILLTIDVTRRTLARRCPMLAMETRGSRIEGWLGLLALAMIPAAALLPRLISSGGLRETLGWSVAGLMAGVPLLWLVNMAIYQFSGNYARRLHRALLLRSVVWPLALLMLPAAVALPCLRKEESYWITRLGYDAFTPENNIFNTRTDRQTAEGVRAETLKALESLR